MLTPETLPGPPLGILPDTAYPTTRLTLTHARPPEASFCTQTASPTPPTPTPTTPSTVCTRP